MSVIKRAGITKIVICAILTGLNAYASEQQRAILSPPSDYQPLSAEALSKIEVVLSSFDPTSGGTVWLWRNGAIKSLASAEAGTLLPTISPDGKMVAFVVPSVANAPLIDNAAFEIRVEDLDGHDVAEILIAPDRDQNGDRALAVAPQNVLHLAWVSKDKLLISGNTNPVSSIGYTIPVIRAVKPLRFPYEPASGSVEFDDAGPLAVSPLGMHVASVTGLEPSKSYRACPEVNESIEIDGIVMPTPAAIRPFSVVAPFAWSGETSFATVIHTRQGLAVLRAERVAPTFRLRKPEGVQGDDGSNIINPPNMTDIALPLAGSKSFARLEPVFRGTQLELRQLDSHKSQVGSWSINGGQAVRLSSVPKADVSMAEASATRDKMVRSVLRLFPDKLASHFATMNIWCRTSGCGPLADLPLHSQIGQSDAAPLPAVCRDAR